MSAPACRFAVVVGFDYYAQYLSQLMNENSGKWCLRAFPSSRTGIVRALWSLRKADALISFGGPGPNVALAEAAQMRHIPVTVIWAGSDVLTAAETPFDLAVVKRRGFDNIADGSWLVDELHDLGVTAEYLPVTAVTAAETVAPLQSAFRVLTYLPEPRREFYGEARVYAIARAMPDVEFIVIGSGRRNTDAPPNVTFLGYVKDVSAHIDASTVLLRVPEHDGKSMLVLETLARARHVVWTHGFPGVRAVADAEQALAALRSLRQKHSLGILALNLAGRDYVRDNFSRHKVASRLQSHLDAVVRSHSRLRNGRPRRVAISGLGLFSAEVAKQVELLHPQWKASVLSVNSRLEVLASLLALVRAELWYSIGSPITDRWLHLCARLLRKRRVIHWVGTDLENLRNSVSLQKSVRAPAIKHLTEVTWMAEELQSLGLGSEIAPLPLRHASSAVKPLPERFTIMLYVPKSRPEFYGQKEYEMLLREFATESPRVLVVGGGKLQAPESLEVVNLGWRDDLRDAYEQTTVLIRLTPRDGLSLMVLEALAHGRFVMWSKPFPCAIHVSRRDELVANLRSLLALHRAGELTAQYVSAEMVARRYSAQNAIDGILRAWESVR